MLVPFTKQVVSEDGRDEVVLESPEALVAAASQKLGRPVDPNAFLLATLIASEEGRGTPTVQAAVAHAARNRAVQLGKTLDELLLPDGRLASQSVGYGSSAVRYAAMDEPPSAAQLAVAEGVISKRIADPTGGAVQWDSPNAQRALAAHGHKKTKRTPEQVADERKKRGMTMVTLPGVSADRLRFWRPPTRSAGVGASLAIAQRDAGQFERAFDTLGAALPGAPDEAIYGILAYAPPLELELEDVGPDGLVGHDQSYGDIADEVGAGKKPGIPTTPVPKLVAALAEKWGGIWGVPKSFIQTIADIESSNIPAKHNLNDRAIKLGGAWGLMEITFRTGEDLARVVRKTEEARKWKEIARVLKEKWHGNAEDLLDPELNVMLGAYYLSRLFRDFRDIDKVAAGYHAGPRAVASALRRGGDAWKSLLGPYSRAYIGMAEGAYPRYA